MNVFNARFFQRSRGMTYTSKRKKGKREREIISHIAYGLNVGYSNRHSIKAPYSLDQTTESEVLLDDDV